MKNAKKAKVAKAEPARRRAARRASDRDPGAPVVKRRERSDDGDAFIPDPGEGPARTRDDLAEILAEDFVEAATRGNEVLEDDFDRTLPDEVGGPFVLTDENEELADGEDESNPADAEVEPLPRANAGLVQKPRQDRIRIKNEGDDEDGDEEGDEDGDGAELDEDTLPGRRR